MIFLNYIRVYIIFIKTIQVNFVVNVRVCFCSNEMQLCRIWRAKQRRELGAGGAEREVSSEMIADLAPGDYVMVHAGMAIAKITGDDETQAEDIMDELEDLLS